MVASMMSPDRPLSLLVTATGTWTVGDGVGGGAFSAADFAKILSSFSLTNNPILSNSMRMVMWQQPPDYPMAGRPGAGE
jgi:hypothetical protein